MSDDIQSLLTAIAELKSDRWVVEALEKRGIPILNADMAEIQENIRTETPFSQAALSGKFGRKTKAVQGENFGFDTGKLQNSWLDGIEIKNGEIVRNLDLEYVGEQQDIVSAKSPYQDGYLTVTDKALDDVLEAIADEAENVWNSTI